MLPQSRQMWGWCCPRWPVPRKALPVPRCSSRGRPRLSPACPGEESNEMPQQLLGLGYSLFLPLPSTLWVKRRLDSVISALRRTENG